MKYSYNILIFVIIFVLIILYNSFTKNYNRIGFENQSSRWSPDLIRRFNIYQTTVNKNNNFINIFHIKI